MKEIIVKSKATPGRIASPFSYTNCEGVKRLTYRVIGSQWGLNHEGAAFKRRLREILAEGLVINPNQTRSSSAITPIIASDRAEASITDLRTSILSIVSIAVCITVTTVSRSISSIAVCLAALAAILISPILSCRGRARVRTKRFRRESKKRRNE